MILSSKTYQYLLSLTEASAREMEDFICSPYFNKNKDLVVLYRELMKLIELDKSPKQVNAKDLFARIRKEKYSEQKMRYLLSDLNVLCEEFFAIKKLREKKDLKKQLLVEELYRRRQKKYTAQHQQALLELSEKNLLQDSDTLGLKLQSEETAYKFASENDNRSIDSRLQKLSDSIDVYYLAKKMKYTCEMINRRNVLQVEYTIRFVEEIRNFLPSSGFLEVPAIALYYHILNSLTEPQNEAHYHALKTGLMKHRSVFSRTEMKDMFTFAQNYCIRQLNSGKEAYLKELFSNYCYLLEEKIIIDNENLSQFDFKNIVTIALRLHQYDWVKKFISSHLVYLPAGERRNAEVYNLSRLYYSMKETRRALQLMQDVEFTDIYYHLDAKVLLIKIYYETSAVEAFIPLHNSFNNYLKRNKKVSAYQRMAYQNFLKLILKMFNYNLFDKGRLDEIERLMTGAGNVADINWLRERFALLTA